jgi:hypothetical protein
MGCRFITCPGPPLDESNPHYFPEGKATENTSGRVLGKDTTRRVLVGNEETLTRIRTATYKMDAYEAPVPVHCSAGAGGSSYSQAFRWLSIRPDTERSANASSKLVIE